MAACGRPEDVPSDGVLSLQDAPGDGADGFRAPVAVREVPALLDARPGEVERRGAPERVDALVDVAGDVDPVDLAAVAPLLEQGVLDGAEVLELVDPEELDVRDVAFFEADVHVVVVFEPPRHPLTLVLVPGAQELPDAAVRELDVHG